MSQLLHDLRVWLWGCFNEHPDIKESKLIVLPPIQWQIVPNLTAFVVEIRVRRPKVFLLNSLEMEDDYLGRGLN